MKSRGRPRIPTVELKRDAYGFTVRPQHLQRYHEYAKIYKEEEEERSNRWKDFLDRICESKEGVTKDSSVDESLGGANNVAGAEGNQNGTGNHEALEEVASKNTSEARAHKIQIWSQIRPSLSAIEETMSYRVKKRRRPYSDGEVTGSNGTFPALNEQNKGVPRSARGASEEESEEEFYDVDRPELVQEASGGADLPTDDAPSFPWKEELQSLVRGGLPMALRGELWQAFVGVRARRVSGYYDGLLSTEADTENGNASDHESSNSNDSELSKATRRCIPEKWKGQIEKDLPRTFPGHPALDEDGRNALRRLLTAYARHNPSVGYCQAMNFFAGLLLLLMPEENAFWTLVGIIDDYFDGYYSEEMIESQVDQLVLEDLVRERFPKLVNHLDYLGVQIAWVTGPWFLSIFVNMLPWETVLRIWDVLLFYGNRVMLFHSALALMELYGPALVMTRDAGDAVTLLQSLAGSTFDSSQLVLTACMGFQAVSEMKLEDLRKKHRPEVLAVMEERSRGLRVWKNSQGLASKLYSFKRGPESLHAETDSKVGSGELQINESSEGYKSSLAVDGESDSVPDLKEQVKWLKVELCRLLVEKRSAALRAEELETALMEMVKQDNRRLLSAQVEQLEQELLTLQQALVEKQEGENAMLQVLMRLEQEQKVTEDARMLAEQDAASQKYTAHMLQEKHEEIMVALANMEKRAVMAESMLEATIQYQSGHAKSQEPLPSPSRKAGLLSRPFGLGWLDKKKGKPEDANEGKSPSDVVQQQSPTSQGDTGGLQPSDE
ncbi:TBC1 domain family member 8B-like [Zingiber officinale]|uniref:TBC1 domain family member 8B-like n=1 Tax=Zingiber officinale TaxID=94328 RepID=UPI001C4DA789|nr:TBC1 domain family member 8B-like [Zingiber officinale]